VKYIDGTLPRDRVLELTLQSIRAGLDDLWQLRQGAQGDVLLDPHWLLPELPLDRLACHRDTPEEHAEYQNGLQKDMVRNTDPKVLVGTHHIVRYPGGTVISALAQEQKCCNRWTKFVTNCTGV
jgi:hypothetical protein